MSISRRLPLRLPSRGSFAVSLVLPVLLLAGCAGGGGTGIEIDTLIPEVATPYTELRRLDGPAPIAGDLVDGGAGDWLLGNERFAVVVGDVSRRGVFARTGGNLLDAAPRGGRDVIREVFTYLDDTFPRQAEYVQAYDGSPADSSWRTLVVQGWDGDDTDLRFETRYGVRAGSSELLITTSVRNAGADTVRAYELGDAVQWGRAVPFAPGPGFDLVGSRPVVPWLGGQAEGTAYLFHADTTFTGPHGGTWSDPIWATVDLAPGDTARYVRRLVIHKGSLAGAERLALPDVPVGLAARVTGEDDRPVAGARVEVLDAEGRPRSLGLTRADGQVAFAAPPGRYGVRVVDARRGVRRRDGIEVGAGGETVHLTLPEPARLDLTARDESGGLLPAKWILLGIEDTETPDLGPNYRIDGARNVLFAPAGSLAAIVPPGRYQVTCLRGMRRDAWRTDIDLRPGRSLALEAVLPALPLGGDWVSADLHVHSLGSNDSNVSPADRIRAMACEGVDWFAPTDHGRRTDYAAVLDTVSLAAPVGVFPGEETTTSTWGHFNAFPLPVTDGEAGGALDPEGMLPPAIVDALRAAGEDVLVQANHPRSGRDGYLDATDYPPGDSLAFTREIDLLEVLNGKRLTSFARVWRDWERFLRYRIPVTGTANSDSHDLVDLPGGWPRNLVLVEGPPTGEGVRDALRRGRVVATNGPLIDFTLEGQPVGGRVTLASGNTATGWLRVVAPTWMDVSRVIVTVNGKDDSVYPVHGRDRTVRFEEAIRVRVEGSAFVQVRVEGDEGMAPLVPDRRESGMVVPVKPLAFTNPIWVDLR